MGRRLPYRFIFVLVLLELGAGYPANAGGSRSSDGKIEIPITAEIRNFDAKKIEVKYRGKILILPIHYAGLPKDLEPRPDQEIKIRFTLTNWSKFSDKLQDFRLGSTAKIDLREDLKQ